MHSMIKLIVLTLFLNQISSQPTFNYVRDSNFTKQVNCTNQALATSYGCQMSWSGSYWYPYYTAAPAPLVQVQRQTFFQTTLTNINIVPLDYKNGTIYKRKGMSNRVAPLSKGTYTFTFKAMTRKTGTPSDFNFSVVIGGSVLANKTYNFSTLGTISVSETLVVASDILTTSVLTFASGGSTTTQYTTPIAAGITDVKIIKVSCNVDESSTLLNTTNQTVCLSNDFLSKSPNCYAFRYSQRFVMMDYTYTYIFNCYKCIQPYMLAVLYNSSNPAQNTFGCTSLLVPNAKGYKKTTIVDSNGKIYLTPNQCIIGSNIDGSKLIVPSITASSYDSSGMSCKLVINDSSVLSWQIQNFDYLPSECIPGLSPTITYKNQKTCASISSTITNCAIYREFAQGKYMCEKCFLNLIGIRLFTNQVTTSVCVDNVEKIDNCKSYTSGLLQNGNNGYICYQCLSGFKLITVGQVRICNPAYLVDDHCTTYVLNEDGLYECSACLQGLTLSIFSTNSGIAKKCLDNYTQFISDQ